MSQILPKLWLSDVNTAREKSFLINENITHILNCAEEVDARPSCYKIPITIVHIPMEDDETPIIEKQLQEAISVLNTWDQEGHTVLVHCRAGISRSATVILAWLIQYKGMSFDDAWSIVVKSRNIIRPNDYFMKLLKTIKPV